MITGNEAITPKLEHTLNSQNGLSKVWAVGGLTIRQHFAAMAMQGLLTQTVTPFLKRESDEYKTEPVFKTPYLSTDGDIIISELASDAVAIADALIEELNKEEVGAKGKVY